MSERLSRRAVLAAIALAPAPTPAAVRFVDDSASISIDLGDTVGAAGFHAWCQLLDDLATEATDIRHQHYDRAGESGELWNATAEDVWGWTYVHLSNMDIGPADTDADALPADTVEALRRVTLDDDGETRP